MDRSLNKKGITLSTYIVILFVGLATMNVINRYYVFMFIAMGLFFILKPKRKLYIDILPVSLLLVLGVSWLIFSPGSTESLIGVPKPFTYVFCFIMGTAFINDDSEYSLNATPYKLFYKVTFVLAMGPFVHYLLNWVTNLGANNRNTIDIWSGETLSATGQAALACLPLALAVACLFFKNKLWIKITSVVTIALIQIYNLVLAGRTLVVLLLVIVAIALLYRLIMEKKGRVQIIIIVVATVVLLLALYQFDVFGVKTYIEESLLYERFFGENSNLELGEDSRLDKKLYYLQNWDKYLLGGVNLRDEIGYAHDIYLDTYDEAGVFAFIAVTGYLIIALWRLFKCVTNKKLPFGFRMIVLCIYGVMYFEFFAEPILQGVPWLFASFCLIDGYVAGILRHDKMVNDNLLNKKV